MTLRISTRHEGADQVVAVDGRLDARGLDELERVVNCASGRVRLEFAGLTSADDTALAALRAWRARGVALVGVSPYFSLLLEEGEPGKARERPPPENARARDPRGRRQRRIRETPETEA